KRGIDGERVVHRRTHRFRQSIVSEVAHDADDRRVAILPAAHADALADRILTAEAVLEHLLIDEDHGIQRIAIARREPSAAKPRDTDRLEVLRRDVLEMRDELLARLRYRRPLDVRFRLQIPAAEWNALGRRRERHTG